MLFIESKTSDQNVDGATRILLLERLQEKGLIPLIRSARLNCYELALLGTDRMQAMERAIAAWTETDKNSTYVRGDVFCFEDFVLFLIFGDDGNGPTGMRTGIIYGPETSEPQKKLDAFCRSVRDALDAAHVGGLEESKRDFAEWRTREQRVVDGSARFAASRETETSLVIKENGVERRLALELLDDDGARRFLHRISEAQADCRVAELTAGEGGVKTTENLINRLADVGLLRREVLVSCRKAGRSLFRLPSSEALNVLTASNAVCSECGGSIADEKVEELIAPSESAFTLMEDGSWLANRVRAVLRQLGVPEKYIINVPAQGDGGAHLIVNVCNEPFLFVLRDGDVTAAHARRALDKLIETKTTHLVVVGTGKIHDQVRVRLSEYAHDRARRGNEVEVILVEGVDALSAELQPAFERVSQRALAEELCFLDSGLGISIGYMIATRFRLMQRSGNLKDLAESAIGALAGSLREF